MDTSEVDALVEARLQPRDPLQQRRRLLLRSGIRNCPMENRRPYIPKSDGKSATVYTEGTAPLVYMVVPTYGRQFSRACSREIRSSSADVCCSGQAFVSHTKCFESRFVEVKSSTNPSTYPFVLLALVSVRVRGGFREPTPSQNRQLIAYYY